ncbi:MAG: pyridoxamine 5'-phosphate oxidase [Alcaligenaceae bacterium]|nr:pyridoxamine 5'-phosphate oxidase [Alcaligenaceae bacterium]
MSIADLRQKYERNVLLESQLAPDPMTQFSNWFEEARQGEILEPNAMIVSTVSAEGKPSSRTVLLKGFDQEGLVFFTSYESNKGKDLSANPNISALFCWLPLQRQVQINGHVVKLTEEASTDYFNSRPEESRIGAWASIQSQPITRAELESREQHFKEKFGSHIPKPPYWGGYLIIPETIEFWQGRPSRLHDRIQYSKDNNGNWTFTRLSP